MTERSMREIQESIKDIIFTFLPDKKVTNKDMSDYLNIPTATYYTQLKRNSIPYREILAWCERTGTSPIEVFYKKET